MHVCCCYGYLELDDCDFLWYNESHNQITDLKSEPIFLDIILFPTVATSRMNFVLSKILGEK